MLRRLPRYKGRLNLLLLLMVKASLRGRGNFIFKEHKKTTKQNSTGSAI